MSGTTQIVEKKPAEAVIPQTENNIVVDAAKNGGTVSSSTASQILNSSGPVTDFEQQLVDYNNKLKGTAGTTTPTATPPAYKPPRNVEEFLAQNQEPPETPEQRMKREKQERTNNIVAGIGDMLTALANMYYTSKGAPSMYNPKEGMSAKMQARYDMLQKEREAREKEYRSGLARAQQLDDQYNLSWERLKTQRARWQQQDEERRRLTEEKRRLAEEKALKDEEKRRNAYQADFWSKKGDKVKAAFYSALAKGYDTQQAKEYSEAVAEGIRNSKKKKTTRRKTNPKNGSTVDPYAQYERK